jgi:hypothetical protein
MNSALRWSKQTLYNPFLYLAGVKSLVIGIVVLLSISFFSYLSGTHYWGIIIPYFAKDNTFLYYLSEHFIHWIVLSIFLFVSGNIFSKSKIRFVDVLGTQAIAFIPFVLVPLVRLLPPFGSFYFFSIYTFILYGLHVITVIWSVALMFNAYRVTCNVKKANLTISFIGTLFLAEIISIVCIYFFKTNAYL